MLQNYIYLHIVFKSNTNSSRHNQCITNRWATLGCGIIPSVVLNTQQDVDKINWFKGLRLL